MVTEAISRRSVFALRKQSRLCIYTLVLNRTATTPPLHGVVLKKHHKRCYPGQPILWNPIM